VTSSLAKLLKGGAFEFQMGLRRGDEEFFRNRPENAALLSERAHWLAIDPERHTAQDPEGAGAITETIDFARAVNPGLAADSLLILGREWEPDFLLLRPDAAGIFRLVAGCVCFPSHWVLREKMGNPVSAIHAPVPTLNATLGAKIDTFLAGLRADTLWERWNWGLAATCELNDHPQRGLARLNAETPLDSCWFRSEHQAFRRLPASGAILFAIRLELVPLTALAEDRALAQRLAEALRTMPEEVAVYKGLATARFSLADRLLDG
jgi:hypothetical protein